MADITMVVNDDVKVSSRPLQKVEISFDLINTKVKKVLDLPTGQMDHIVYSFTTP